MNYSKLSDSTLKALSEGKHPDYSSLSNEELQALAQVEPSPAEKYSGGRSALMGAEQGLLLGGADELGGGIQSALNLGQSGLHNIVPSLVGPSPTQANQALADAGTKGDVGPTNSAQMYRQAQQENQKDYEDAQTANPMSYLGGTLAGGLLGMKGLGMARLAPELIAAEKGAPGLRTILAEKGWTPAMVEALKRGGAATINAAPIGAAYGALDSKGTIENSPGQIVADTARGAGTAGGIGLGLNLASEVGVPLAQATGQYIGGKLFNREALQKFASGRAAAALGVKATTNAKRDIGQTLLDNNALPILGGSEATSNAINSAQESVGNNRIGPALEQIQNGLGNKGTQVNDLVNQAGDIFNDFKEQMSNRADGPTIVAKVEKELTPYLDHVATNGVDVKALNAMKKGLQAQEQASYQVLANGQRQPTPESNLYMKLASAIRQHIEDLGTQVDPDLGNQLASANKDWGNLDEAGKAANKLVNKDAKSSLITPLKVGAALINPHYGLPILGADTVAKVVTGNPIMRTANTIAAKGANWLANGKAPNAVLGASKSLYNATTEQLHGFSDNLMSVPGAQATGQALRNALQTNDNTAKNAVLFSIMQQPKLRKLIQGESDQPDQQ